MKPWPSWSRVSPPDGDGPVQASRDANAGATSNVPASSSVASARLDDTEYSSPGLAAKADGAEDEDGWLYWSAEINSRTVVLDEVRWSQPAN